MAGQIIVVLDLVTRGPCGCSKTDDIIYHKRNMGFVIGPKVNLDAKMDLDAPAFIPSATPRSHCGGLFHLRET
jgi:hypothetical protein